MTIKGVWGFNGTERPGAVYLASHFESLMLQGLFGKNKTDETTKLYHRFVRLWYG